MCVTWHAKCWQNWIEHCFLLFFRLIEFSHSHLFILMQSIFDFTGYNFRLSSIKRTNTFMTCSALYLNIIPQIICLRKDGWLDVYLRFMCKLFNIRESFINFSRSLFSLLLRISSLICLIVCVCVCLHRQAVAADTMSQSPDMWWIPSNANQD